MLQCLKVYNMQNTITFAQAMQSAHACCVVNYNNVAYIVTAQYIYVDGKYMYGDNVNVFVQSTQAYVTNAAINNKVCFIANNNMQAQYKQIGRAAQAA